MRRDEREAPMSFIGAIKKYIGLQVEYYQLTLTEKIALLLAKTALIVFTATLVLTILLLLLVLIYVLLMQWIGIPWVVVLIEIGLALLLIAILWIFKESLIIRPVSNTIIRVILDDENHQNGKEEEYD